MLEYLLNRPSHHPQYTKSRPDRGAGILRCGSARVRFLEYCHNPTLTQCFTIRWVLLSAILSAMLSLHPQQVSAQQSPVSAQVDRSVIALNQTVDFIITVAGGNSARPSLPALDGLTIVGTSSASQTNIVGGQISSQVSYRYTLQPTREGETTIPQVAVVVDGQLYTTEPITVQITAAATSAGNGSSGQPGSAAPSNAAGNDIFIEAFNPSGSFS